MSCHLRHQCEHERNPPLRPDQNGIDRSYWSIPGKVTFTIAPGSLDTEIADGSLRYQACRQQRCGGPTLPAAACRAAVLKPRPRFQLERRVGAAWLACDPRQPGLVNTTFHLEWHLNSVLIECNWTWQFLLDLRHPGRIGRQIASQICRQPAEKGHCGGRLAMSDAEPEQRCCYWFQRPACHLHDRVCR